MVERSCKTCAYAIHELFPRCAMVVGKDKKPVGFLKAMIAHCGIGRKLWEARGENKNG